MIFTMGQAVDVLLNNYKEWTARGLRMVNVNEVDEAMRFLFDNTPFDWEGTFDAWKRDKEAR